MNSFRSLTHPERIQNLKGILLEPPEGIVHGNYHSAEEQQGHQQNSLKARPEKMTFDMALLTSCGHQIIATEANNICG
jgi:hypothetical protein